MQLRPSHGPSSTLSESLECWAGVSVFSLDRATHADRGQYFPAINMALAFCMGPDLQSLIDIPQLAHPAQPSPYSLSPSPFVSLVIMADVSFTPTPDHPSRKGKEREAPQPTDIAAKIFAIQRKNAQ